MTLSIKVRVNGDYRATVLRNGEVIGTVDGDRHDQPHTKEQEFTWGSPVTFTVTEEPLTPEMKAERDAPKQEADQSATLGQGTSVAGTQEQA